METPFPPKKYCTIVIVDQNHNLFATHLLTAKYNHARLTVHGSHSLIRSPIRYRLYLFQTQICFLHHFIVAQIGGSIFKHNLAALQHIPAMSDG